MAKVMSYDKIDHKSLPKRQAELGVEEDEKFERWRGEENEGRDERPAREERV